jgi:hypothetical protein
MAIVQGFCDVAKQAFISGAHTPAHTYKIALYTSAATLDHTTTQYTATGESSGTGYTGGGQVLTSYANGLSSGVGYLNWANPSWPASSITARGAMIWNTSGSQSIAILNFGQDYTSTNGTFTITFPAAGSSAVITIS